MSFNKVLASDQYGSLAVSEAAGVVTLTGSLQLSVGGGEAAGVVGVSSGINITLSAKQLVDLGLDLAKAKFPTAATFITAAQSAIDAELSKL